MRKVYLKINHAYCLTKLVNRDYVKKVNDSQDCAIHNTFSHFAAFFIVAVTKRSNVNRFILCDLSFIETSMDTRKKERDLHQIHSLKELLLAPN